MKTIDELKDEVMQELSELHNDDYQSWDDVLSWVDQDSPWEMVCERHANQVAKEALKSACAVTINHYFVTHDDKPIERHVLEDLINNENNIPELI